MEKTKSVPLELMTSSGPTLSTTPSFQQFLKQSTVHPVNGVCVCLCIYLHVCLYMHIIICMYVFVCIHAKAQLLSNLTHCFHRNEIN